MFTCFAGRFVLDAERNELLYFSRAMSYSAAVSDGGPNSSRSGKLKGVMPMLGAHVGMGSVMGEFNVTPAPAAGLAAQGAAGKSRTFFLRADGELSHTREWVEALALSARGTPPTPEAVGHAHRRGSMEGGVLPIEREGAGRDVGDADDYAFNPDDPAYALGGGSEALAANSVEALLSAHFQRHSPADGQHASAVMRHFAGREGALRKLIEQDVEGKGIVDELKLDLPMADPKSKALPTSCISLAWSADGNTLFAGYTDNMIRAWQVTAGQNTIF